MTYSQLVEWYYTKKAKETNRIIPNQPKFDEIQRRRRLTYVGGYVKEPEAGIHENLAVIDFASLYPTIIATYNISTETLNCQCCKDDGYRVPGLLYWFCKKKQGFESEIIKELLFRRWKLKKKLKELPKGSHEYVVLNAKQLALKTVANSLHPDELVVLMDPNERVKLMKIGEFVDKFVKYKNKNGYEYGIPHGFKALCFDGFNLCFRKINRCIRHKCSSRMYKLVLASGRSVRVTEDHSVFTFVDGNIVPVAVSELKAGDYIVVPKKLSYNVKTIKSINLLEELERIDKELIKDLLVEIPCKGKYRLVLLNRLRILEALRKSDMFIKDISRASGLSVSAVSKHLKRLEKLKYVKLLRHTNGRKIYSITESGIKHMLFLKVFLKFAHYHFNPNKRGVYLIPFEKLKGVHKYAENVSSWKVGPINGVRIPVVLKVTPQLMRFLGYYVSEGHSRMFKNRNGGMSYDITLFNNRRKILEDMFECARSLSLNPVMKNRYVKISNKMAYILIEILKCGKNSYEKKVPWIVFSSPNELKNEFLKAYFLGDGHVLKERIIFFTTASKFLVNGLTLLLQQMGIKGIRISKEKNYYRIKVLESLPFVKVKNAERRVTPFVIPGFLIKNFLKDLGNREAYRKFGYAKRYCVSWRKFREFVNYYESLRGYSPELRKIFALNHGDLALDKIKEKKLIDSVDYVYDLSVEGTENFVGGLGLVCLHNSSYGYYAFPASKWYSKECAESTAAWGRYWIKKIESEAEENGFKVIYIDTDSCFIKLGNKTKEDILKFLEETNKKLPGIMRIDLEDFYVRGIFIPRGIAPGTAKKRYALLDEKGYLKIRGLEKVRRDWSELAKRTQEKVLRLILEKKDLKGAISYVREVIQKLKKLDVNLRDLVIYEQITKPLEEYKQISPHVIAARKLLNYGIPVGPGSVIGFVITKGSGSISQRAEPVEFVDLKSVDVDYYITNQVLPAALRVLRVLGVDEKQLLTPSGLDRFFT